LGALYTNAEIGLKYHGKIILDFLGTFFHINNGKMSCFAVMNQHVIKCKVKLMCPNKNNEFINNELTIYIG